MSQWRQNARTEAPEIPEYDDARRKQEILSPRNKWPVAYRPPLQGKVKILEDRPLTGHTIRLVDGGVRPTTSENTGEKQRGEVQTFMDLVTPQLEKWLREHLLSVGLPTHIGGEGGKKKENPPERRATKGERGR